MRFAGVTRFAVVTSKTFTSFTATRGMALDEAKRAVFDSARLEAKLATFENFCLPTYREFAEQDDRSHGVVVTSHDLPEPYRNRLIEACQDVPRVRVLELEDDDSISGRVNPVLAEIAAGDRLFNYRYDDDDVLSADFLRRVEKICETVPDDTAISMNTGFFVGRLAHDEFGVFEQKYPLNAYGLGVVVDGVQPRSIFDFGRHNRLETAVFHEVGTPSWIAFRHGFNSSQVRGTELNRLKRLVDGRRSGAEVAELLHEHFPQMAPAGLRDLPVLPVHEILDGVARTAVRRNRALEAELVTARHDLERTRTELTSTRTALERTRTALTRTRAALERTRGDLRSLRRSRSFRLARALAETRGLRSVASLPRRAWAAGRRPPAPPAAD